MKLSANLILSTASTKPQVKFSGDFKLNLIVRWYSLILKFRDLDCYLTG
jgi:hypothetical protein